jgi:hypothetical protein
VSYESGRGGRERERERDGEREIREFDLHLIIKGSNGFKNQT